MKGLVTRSTGSWYTVKTEDNSIYQARLRGKFKQDNLKVTNPIAVGDHVIIMIEKGEEQTAIITEILPRKNYIIRVSSRNHHHNHLIASNLDQAVIFVSWKQPRTSLGFLDRFLVTAEAYQVPALIVFSKIDLLNKNGLRDIENISKEYASLGYACHKISCETKEGIDNLTEALRGKVSLISGLSGAGKSTLINTINPELHLKTQAISKFSNKGTHTTTYAEMHEVIEGINIIDTPGIKEFGLSGFKAEEISHFFPEMRQFLGQCYYHNCTHVHEPDCKVLDALMENRISEKRYDSYLSMLEDKDNRH